MSCNSFTATNPSCKTIQMIEPDDTLLTSIVSSGGRDQSLDESGSVILEVNLLASVHVDFVTTKVSDNYRFEYLYIDALGIPLPGVIQPVVVDANKFGFTVSLAGIPVEEGHILRWRVVVIDITLNLAVDDSESLRLQLPQAQQFTAVFVNPRSTINYGFTELRVENLTDSFDTQRPILVQVMQKTTGGFTIGLNPQPDSDNYYLVARTP